MLSFNNQPITDAVSILADSFLVRNFASRFLGYYNNAVFNELTHTAPWTDPTDSAFKYRGNELKRQKAFWTESYDPMQKYTYPGFQYTSMLSYHPISDTPIIKNIVHHLQANLRVGKEPITINHVIATRYRGADDNIGFHNDKITDITPGSSIISLSFGETREMHIRRNDQTNTQVFVLNPGDLFVLGWNTNLAYQHAIVPVHEERQIQREPNVEVGPRISLVMRNIATTIAREQLAKKIKSSNANKRRKVEKDTLLKNK